MTYKENITAILECYFTGFKEEIIESACNRILEQKPCEDAISREMALKECHDIVVDGERYRVIQEETLLGLPSVNPQEPRWIPVSERLPEEYGEYLITWTTSQSKRPFIGISEGEVTSEYDHEHNRFKFEWLLEDYVKNYSDVKVVAWMPLPKPYMKGDSE